LIDLNKDINHDKFLFSSPVKYKKNNSKKLNSQNIKFITDHSAKNKVNPKTLSSNKKRTSHKHFDKNYYKDKIDNFCVASRKNCVNMLEDKKSYSLSRNYIPNDSFLYGQHYAADDDSFFQNNLKNTNVFNYNLQNMIGINLDEKDTESILSPDLQRKVDIKNQKQTSPKKSILNKDFNHLYSHVKRNKTNTPQNNIPISIKPHNQLYFKKKKITIENGVAQLDYDCRVISFIWKFFFLD